MYIGAPYVTKFCPLTNYSLTDHLINKGLTAVPWRNRLECDKLRKTGLAGNSTMLGVAMTGGYSEHT